MRKERARRWCLRTIAVFYLPFHSGSRMVRASTSAKITAVEFCKKNAEGGSQNIIITQCVLVNVVGTRGRLAAQVPWLREFLYSELQMYCAQLCGTLEAFYRMVRFCIRISSYCKA
jgi:hypothetical protein